MKISIIGRSDSQIEYLIQVILKEGFEQPQTSLRDEFSSFENLLAKVTGDVLIADLSGSEIDSDLKELELFTASRNTTVILLLSEAITSEVLASAMQAGVREVLKLSSVKEELPLCLRRLALRQKTLMTNHPSKAKTVSFISCKGGSGATFLATNFAYILAQELNKNTLFLDLDLQCGDAVYYVSPGPNHSVITDLTKQIDRLDAKLLSSSVLKVAPNFDLLSAPEEAEVTDLMLPVQLERLLALARDNYEMVVLDLDRVIHPLTTQALDQTDTVFIVMQNLLPFLRDAKRIVTKYKALGYEEKRLRLVVNRYEKNDVIDIDQIEKIVGLKVSYTIPSSFLDIAKAINTGVPIIQVNKHNVVVDMLRKMAHEFSGEKPNKNEGWFHRLMNS